MSFFRAWAWVTLNYAYSRVTRGIRAEAFKEGLAVQDLGRRARDGQPARRDAEIFSVHRAQRFDRAILMQEHWETSFADVRGARGVPTSCFGETQYYHHKCPNLGP